MVHDNADEEFTFTVDGDHYCVKTSQGKWLSINNEGGLN